MLQSQGIGGPQTGMEPGCMTACSTGLVMSVALQDLQVGDTSPAL